MFVLQNFLFVWQNDSHQHLLLVFQQARRSEGFQTDSKDAERTLCYNLSLHLSR
jgi:hypothetical protein